MLTVEMVRNIKRLGSNYKSIINKATLDLRLKDSKITRFHKDVYGYWLSPETLRESQNFVGKIILETENWWTLDIFQKAATAD